MKKIFILTSLLLTLTACNTPATNIDEVQTATWAESKLQITTSIIPIASITNTIGWDFVDTTPLVPAGVSPHNFDIKTNQMVDIQNSDLVIYLWLDHIDGFLREAITQKDVLIPTEWIEFLESDWEHDHEEHSEHKDEHEHEDEESHEENEEHEEYNEENHEWEEHDEHEYETDPHVWTSWKNALIIAKNIQNYLSKLQPENTQIFADNYDAFESQLNTVENIFNDSVAWKEQKYFIAFHDAYNYLLEDLEVDSSKKLVFQKNVLTDPNSAEMKELLEEIELHDIKIAYLEPQIDDSNFKSILWEYNITTYTLDPLGTDSSAQGYFEYYKDNLLALQRLYD